MFDNAKNKIETNIVPGKKEGTSALGLKETLLSFLDDTKEAITNQEIYIEYSQNGIDWHSTFLNDDVFMRQKKGDGAWSNAIRIVGIQGIKGDKGADGQTQYVHIRYSANSNGSSMTTTPQANTAYIGIVTTTSSVAPTSNTSYTWAKFKGEQGTQGVPGIPGNDGSSLFTWVKYADTPTSGMSDYPDDKLYIGLAYNKVTATESDDYSDYSWSLMPQNIEIGGKNLLRSFNNWENEGWNILTNYKISIVAGLTHGIISNQISDSGEFVLSFDVVELNGAVRVHNSDGFDQPVTLGKNTFLLNATNQKIVFYGSGGSAVIQNAKLEKGNKATDWTPAPEDVEASILQTKQDSINASKAYADAQDEVKRIQTQAYADGIVTTAEQRAIDDATAKMEASKLYATAQDNLLRTQLEAYADGQITAEEQERIQQMQDNLAVAKAYADAQAELAKITALAYADGIVDEEEARAIADATAKMEIAKQHAQGLVNNIQVGGRNLLFSFNKWENEGWNIISPYEASLIAGTTHGLLSNQIDFNGDFVLTFFAENVIGDVYVHNQKGWNVQISNGYNVFYFNANNPRIVFYGALGSALIKRAKLEKGNKATDWTPAPEDVESAYKAYSDAQAELAKITAQAYADGIVDEEEARAIADATAKMEIAKQHAQGLVNNIQIGGRNLILGTSDFKGWTNENNRWKVVSNGVIESTNPIGNDGNGLLSKYYDLEKGQYTLSFTASNVINNSTRNNYLDTGSFAGLKIVNEGLNKYTVTLNNDINFRFVFYHSQGDSMRISNIQLEKGNKATDWTPAPEDVESAINDVKVKAENALTQLTSIANDNILSPSEKQQVSNEWNRIKSEYVSNYSLGISNGVDTTNLTSAYNDLFNYINPLLVNISVDSPIVGDVFRTKFKAYYDQNIALIVAINDKIKQGINNNANNINNLNSSIARINQITSFLNTTVNGNVIGTGVLIVGSETQSNAGISGLNESGSKSVRLWAGGTAQNRDKAAWNTLDDGTMQFFHPNGNIAFRFGLSNGKFIMDGYHEQGMKLWELSPNRGLVNVAYIPESWTNTPMININQSSSTLDVASAQSFLNSLVLEDFRYPGQIGEDGFYRWYFNNNYTSFEYQNGTHPDNSQYANLIGYKSQNDSRTANIPNGWYGLLIGTIANAVGEYPPPRPTVNYILYYVENGKVMKTQNINF